MDAESYRADIRDILSTIAFDKLWSYVNVREACWTGSLRDTIILEEIRKYVDEHYPPIVPQTKTSRMMGSRLR